MSLKKNVMVPVFSLCVLSLALIGSSAVTAQDEDDSGNDYSNDDSGGLSFKFGGKVQSDLRFQVVDKEVGEFYNKLKVPLGIRRNENILNFNGQASMGRVAAVFDLDFVLYGHPDSLQEMGDLSLKQKLDPYRFEAHAAYLEVDDFLFEGLDLRVGQQLVLWGVGDQFNPTNTINANDLEDVLLFGDEQANVMARLDYALPTGLDIPGIAEQWSISGVLVPVFKPALLPRSAALGLAQVDRMPLMEAPLRYRMLVEEEVAKSRFRYPTVVNVVKPSLPGTDFDNMQAAVRLAGTLLGQDMALSYYYGRSDRPQAMENYTVQTNRVECPAGMASKCTDNPDDPGCAGCIKGVLSTDVKLQYPRMEVIGFNMAGEIPLDWIDPEIYPIGYRLELGVYLPRRAEMRIMQDEISLGGLKQPQGEYDYETGRRPTVIDSTPFLKWSLGIDYSLGTHVMLNTIWVHGLVDEFGAGDFFHQGWTVQKAYTQGDEDEMFTCMVADRMGLSKCNYSKYAVEILRPRLADYLVFGMDFKFLDGRALLRFFSIWDLTGVYEDRWDAGGRVRKHYGMFTNKGFSAVIYPEFNYNFGDGFDLGLGALLQLGKDYTKFGDPAAGGSFVWTRARYRY
ncbi:MAG: hypothetical protein GXP49_10095 [Deltaproteobacteria bacterium]|nr:hypothetical protein [Deltaproteobacteria bacterium]